jgi:shikimate dehydrogenase
MQGKPPLEISLDGLNPKALVTDLVYVPLTTPLLEAAAARGHKTVDGLGMLLHQAVPGFEKWFGVRPQVTAELRRLVEDDIGRTP